MSVTATMGVSNRAFVGEDGGHSVSKDSGIADLSEIVPELPPKTSPRPSPKVFVKNPSAHKYENQLPLPPGAGSANSTSKKRPDNLAIPSHISSMKNNGRPVSSVHDYEELPLEKKDKSKPRLAKYTPSNDRYTPSPPPIPPVSSMPSQNFDIYSQAGSDVTMMSDGPRKRHNPLYDSAKVISQPDPKDNKSGSDCWGRNRLMWILLILIGVLILVLFILIILVIVGALEAKKLTVTPELQVDHGARNKTKEVEAALQAALKRVKDLESKVVELDTVLSFLGNSSHNSSLLTRFDELVKNSSQNTAAIEALSSQVTANKNKVNNVDSKVDEYRKQAITNNRALSDRINQLQTDEINPLKTDVGKLTTQITEVNQTIFSEIPKLRNDVMLLKETALTACKLNTTIFESFSSVHNELDTPYVSETEDYAVIGAACSSYGFDYNYRRSTEVSVNGVPTMKYFCRCGGKWANAKVLICRAHVLLCSKKKQG